MNRTISRILSRILGLARNIFLVKIVFGRKNVKIGIPKDEPDHLRRYGII